MPHPTLVTLFSLLTLGDASAKRPDALHDSKLVPSWATDCGRMRSPRLELESATTASLVAGESAGPCPADMVVVGRDLCVDRFEASLVEVFPDGTEQPWSPYYSPDGHVVRAVNALGGVPQGYIRGTDAKRACELSRKRLCKPDEWTRACMGPKKTIYTYGSVNEPRRCNDSGKSAMQHYYPLSDSAEDKKKWGNKGSMMDPRLNQLEGSIAPSGTFTGCTNEYGVYDMNGNLHEWVDDPEGTFRGGYYLDTHINGDGCGYATTVHPFSHQDYSTGFRCCADASD